MTFPLPHMAANSVVARISTDSILNPLLWLCGIIEISVIPAAYFSEGDAKVFFCTLAAVPVFFVILAYFIWMFRDPNRLQSESFQLEQQRILHATKEGDVLPMIDQTSEHEAIPYEENDEPDDTPVIGRSPSSTQEGA